MGNKKILTLECFQTVQIIEMINNLFIDSSSN